MTADIVWDDHESPAPPYPGWMPEEEGHAYVRQIAEQFRTAMSALAATVCVVAASSPSGARTGTTATAVCSLSTEPPQIVACVNRGSSIARMLGGTGWFSVNILAGHQEDVASVFAGRGGRQGEARFAEDEWTRHVTGVPLLAIVGLTVFFGVALSTRTQLVLAAVSITVVAAFFVYVIVRVGSANDVVSTFEASKSPRGATGVLFGVLYGVLLFTGFETAANLGEETRQPGRDIPRAVLFSVLAVTGFYLLGSYAQVAGFHFNLDALSKAAGAPLFALASPGAGGFGSVTLVRLMELVVVLDMLAVLLGCATAGSRGLVVLVATQWAALWAVPGEPHYAAMFSVLATFGSFSLACVYFLLSLGAFRGLADHRRRYAVVLAAVVGMLVTGAAIFGAVYKVTGPVAWVPVPAAAVFLIGLATRLKAAGGESSPSLEQVAGTGASEA